FKFVAKSFRILERIKIFKNNFKNSNKKMQEPTITATRGPLLTQANLQAQRGVMRERTGQMHQSVMSSQANSVIGDMPPTTAMRLSKRNSISSTVEHLSHTYYNQNMHKLENTYRLGPGEGQKFNVSKVQKLVNDILSNHLENVKYEPNKCKDLVQLLSEEIKTRIKSIIFRRYKLIVNLTIGQNDGNSIIVASRSLWNADTDNGCTVQYKNSTLFAVATIFATYYD
ncbi:unnamed protein product, partial [Brachionus calyciflorus]